MSIIITKNPTFYDSTHRFHFVNSDYGIKKKDNVSILIKPLSTDQEEQFAIEGQDAVTRVNTPTKSKGGFRDRADDPRVQRETKINAELLKEITLKRIKAALIDWTGFADKNGKELPYSWENFQDVVKSIPDFVLFCDESIVTAFQRAFKKSQAEEKN